MELENQRRKEERDHELRLSSMFMEIGSTQLPSAPSSFVQFNQLQSSAGFNRPSSVTPFAYTNVHESNSTCTSYPPNLQWQVEVLPNKLSHIIT